MINDLNDLLRYNYLLNEIKSEENSLTEKLEWIKKAFRTYMKDYYYEAKVRPRDPRTTSLALAILITILDYDRCTRMRREKSKTFAISRNNVQTKTIRTKND